MPNYQHTSYKAGALIALGLAAATQVWAGEIVGLNAAGFLVPASDPSAESVVGRSEGNFDSTDALAGEVTAEVRRKCAFSLANNAAAPVTQADLFTECYLSDANEVSISDDDGSGAGSRLTAGLVIGLSDNQVWVEM